MVAPSGNYGREAAGGTCNRVRPTNAPRENNIPRSGNENSHQCMLRCRISRRGADERRRCAGLARGSLHRSRDAAIKKFKPLYDAGNIDDAAPKTEDAARADLDAQWHVILRPLSCAGYGPGKLNLDFFYKGDEGFGTLDGLRFHDTIGKNGETAGSKRRWQLCRAESAYHRHDADAVRTMAARPQGVVGQGHQERAAADRRGAQE